MKSFLRLIQYVGNYWEKAVLNATFNIISILFSVVSITMIAPFLRLLFGNQPLVYVEPSLELTVSSGIDYFNYILSKVIIENGQVRGLLFICLIVVTVFLFKNLFRYLAIYFMGTIRTGVVKDVRQAMFNKTMRLDIGYFSSKRKGDIITRMSADVQEVEWGVMSTLEIIFREPVMIILYLSFMLFISPELTLFALILLPLSGIIIGRIGKTLKKTSTKGQEKLGILLSIIEESISGLRIIKAFNAEEFQSGHFATQNHLHFKLMRRIFRKRELASPLAEVMGITIVIAVLWYGGRLVLNENIGLSPESFVVFIVLFSQLIQPAKTFSAAYFKIQKGMASMNRIEEILLRVVEIKEDINPIALNEFKERIEFKDVSFMYEREPVLKKINLTIEKGKMIALVGASGGGKSTLADLIPRFYDTSHGQILIDGINIKNVKLFELRDLMGIVSQESILFNDTVSNNIAYGMKDPDQDRVQEAAKIANAHDFIVKMENGYDSNIGDMGKKLSGGERQRLSIARAIMKNPPILILDEATSSLDSESEKLVQEALLKLMANRTSIVIAHRLSTIQHADAIVVIENGEIIEQGDHNSLIAKSGRYKHLVELQAF